MTLISAPDTEAARAARDLAVEVSHPTLVHHVWRTWYFGHHLIGTHVVDADLEVGFVAAMLHDLGLTGRFDADEPFEQAGAAAAASLLVDLGWPDDRAELVASAIASHLDLASAEARPELALVHLGAAADVVGLRVDELPGPLIEEVLAAHPRDGFAETVLAALTRQVERKPHSTIAGHFRDYAFGDLVTSCALDHR